MSRDATDIAAVDATCPDELARELEGAQEIWNLLGAGEPETLDSGAVDIALARVRASIDAAEPQSAAAVETPCPAELVEALQDDASLIDAHSLWRTLGHGVVEPPSAEALQRAREAVHAELSADAVETELSHEAPAAGEPARVKWWQVALPAAAVMLGFVVLRLLFKAVPFAADLPLALGLGAGAALLAAFVVPHAKMALVSVAALSGVAVAMVSRGGGALGAVAKCGTLELVAAAVPLVIAAAMLWRRGVRSSATTLAAATASGALAGQAALILACPGRNLEHLLVGHVGGVALAAGVGFVVGLLPIFRQPSASASSS